MPLTIGREAANTEDAIVLLKARDAESSAIYPPASKFHIPIDRHVDDKILFLVARENGVAIGCSALQVHEGWAN
jgi:putative acetyltransferase